MMCCRIRLILISIHILLVATYGEDHHIIDWDVYASIHKNAPFPSLWMKTNNQQSVKNQYNYVWYELVQASLSVVDKRHKMIRPKHFMNVILSIVSRVQAMNALCVRGMKYAPSRQKSNTFNSSSPCNAMHIESKLRETFSWVLNVHKSTMLKLPPISAAPNKHQIVS